MDPGSDTVFARRWWKQEQRDKLKLTVTENVSEYREKLNTKQSKVAHKILYHENFEAEMLFSLYKV